MTLSTPVILLQGKLKSVSEILPGCRQDGTRKETSRLPFLSTWVSVVNQAFYHTGHGPVGPDRRWGPETSRVLSGGLRQRSRESLRTPSRLLVSVSTNKIKSHRYKKDGYSVAREH